MLTVWAGYHPTLGNWYPSTLPALLPNVLALEGVGHSLTGFPPQVQWERPGRALNSHH